MSEHRNCQKPDRDFPKMVCGYPLPCPWHTIIISEGAVYQPKHLELERGHVEHLLDIAEAVEPGKR